MSYYVRKNNDNICKLNLMNKTTLTRLAKNGTETDPSSSSKHKYVTDRTNCNVSVDNTCLISDDIPSFVMTPVLIGNLQLYLLTSESV